MKEKQSSLSREKLLLLSIAMLVVMVGGLFTMTKVQDAFATRENRIAALASEEARLQSKVNKGTRAAEVLRDYQQRSLPSDPHLAAATYQDWLLDTGRLYFGDRVQIKQSGDKGRGDVYRQYTFDVTAVGDLEQLTEFLHRFYAMNTLHRVAGMSVKAIDGSRDLELTFRLDALALQTAPAGTGLITAGDVAKLAESLVGLGTAQSLAAVPTAALALPGETVSLAFVQQLRNRVWLQAIAAEPSIRLPATESELADYKRVILSRNLFGLANQQPQTVSLDKQNATTKERFSATVSAKDPDPLDSLRYYLEGDIPAGVELDPVSGRLSWTPAAPGTYPLTVRAEDDGWPTRTATKTFQVKVADRVVVAPTPPPPPTKPAPTFDAKQTVVNAMVQGIDGRPTVWLYIRPQNKMLKLGVGDRFDIGNVKGVIQEIGNKDVVIEIEGKSLLFSKGEKITDGVEVGDATSPDVSNLGNDRLNR